MACGAWVGGCSERAVVLNGLLACAPDRFTLLAEAALVVLPGNACAAASAKAPVRTTLPAMSQRLIR